MSSISRFDRSYIREVSIAQNIPITELILRTFYEKIQEPITLLGVSPISPHIVRAAIIAAKELKAPIMFIASLNQVDIDGGYTGWTPRSFIEFLGKEVEKLGFKEPIIVGLDHGGPWLKDKHIQQGYGLEEAMESAKKSIEAALTAGYDVIHIDTTVDPYARNGVPEVDIVAKRTLELIEFAEDVRKTHDLPRINYEISSDRWKFKDIEHVRELVAQVMHGLEQRGLGEAKILFIVGDVGTKVMPGNRLDTNKAQRLVRLAQTYKLYLKTHSTDYVENPEEFPGIGVGGANIGPMFADVKYRTVKKLVEMEEENIYGEAANEKSNILEILYKSIIDDGRWRKYVKGAKDLEELDIGEREFIIGICTRYVWMDPRVHKALSKLFSNLSKISVDGEKILIEEIKKSIRKYMEKFNLLNLVERFKSSK